MAHALRSSRRESCAVRPSPNGISSTKGYWPRPYYEGCRGSIATEQVLKKTVGEAWTPIGPQKAIEPGPQMRHVKKKNMKIIGRDDRI